MADKTYLDLTDEQTKGGSGRHKLTSDQKRQIKEGLGYEAEEIDLSGDKPRLIISVAELECW